MKREALESAAKISKHTFDVVEPPTQAPRVSYHEAHLRGYGDRFIPEAQRQGVPLDAFGPVTSPTRQRYFTHDNGGRPYLVLVDAARNRATVRRNLARGLASDDGARHTVTYDKLVKRIDYARFWNGYAPFNYGIDYDVAIGNTLLFETTRDGRRLYLLVAGVVCAFELPDGHPPIEHFCAAIGNNDVPEPYAWSDRYAYFLCPDKFIEFTQTEPLAGYVKTGDLASFFYNQRDWKTGTFTSDMTQQQRAAFVPMPRERMPAKIIHSRNAG